MAKQDEAYWILEQVGLVNPYNRSGTNQKSEFYIYQAGWLAAHLASIFRDDPLRRRDFKQHLQSLDKGPAANS